MRMSLHKFEIARTVKTAVQSISFAFERTILRILAHAQNGVLVNDSVWSSSFSRTGQKSPLHRGHSLESGGSAER